MTDEKPGPGFARGKTVYFANTFDGMRLARQYGARAVLKVAEEDRDEYGRIGVALGDGTVVRIDLAHLRLTAPSEPRPKPPVAKERKEAIDPAFGEELSILDLEA